jgi:hypothetical protein
LFTDIVSAGVRGESSGFIFSKQEDDFLQHAYDNRSKYSKEHDINFEGVVA